MIAPVAAGLAAIACACGNPGGGPVVASGKSPSGMPWRIHAKRDGARALDVEFAYGSPGYEDAGAFLQMPYPPPRAFAFDVTLGSDLNPAGEADATGVTARRVVRVRITLADGSTVNARPTLAPVAIRRRRPWLEPLRFFDVFLPKGVEPTRATAFDARDRVLARRPL